MIWGKSGLRRAAGLFAALCFVAVASLGFTLALAPGGGASGAPAVWERQNLPARSAALLAVDGVMDRFARAGWAVGGSGTILRTEDAGATWRAQVSGTSVALHAVSALSAAAAWAVGESGTILFTRDGINWERQGAGGEGDLYGVTALDERHVWAVGEAGAVLYYDGTTWSRQASGASVALRAVSAADASHVWAVGEGGTILFFDGTAWTYQAAGTGNNLLGVTAATGTTRAWACGEGGVLLATTDGAGWSSQASPTQETLFGISAAGSDSVYACGDAGILMRAGNGTAWTLAESGNINPLRGIAAVQPDRAWVAGGGCIETTEDGGATWNIRRLAEAVSTVSSVAPVDAYRAWACGDAGSILHTEDGGSTWLPQASGTDSYLAGIAAGSEDIAWAVGAGGVVLHTADAGATWTSQYDDGLTAFRAVWAVAARTAWAVGDRGIIQKTEDGNTWLAQASGSQADLYSICAANSDIAWAAGEAGVVLATVDGGSHWFAQASGTERSLRGIAAGDYLTLWAVGDAGTILKTTDGGLQWTAQSSGVSVSLTSVCALDAQRAWVAGERGVVLYTADGGATWSKQGSGVRADLRSLRAVDENIAWAAGDGATILRTADRTRYFAEGHTGDGFQEFLCLFNPESSTADVRVEYLFSDGSWQEQEVALAPESRVTLDVNGAVGPGRDVSLVVRSGGDIQSERPVYFDYGGVWSGGSVTSGASGPSLEWYFAEGYTGPGFEQYLCVLNPGTRPAALSFDFQTQEDGPRGLAGYLVAPHSRATFRVNDLLGGAYRNSLRLRSTAPVVAERSMYFDYRGADGVSRTGGHTVVGAPVLGNQYLFAEGTTRSGFDEYLALQNPGTISVQVNAVFETGPEGGGPVTRAFALEAGKRETVPVRDIVGEGKDVSVKVSSASPFLAERAIYFDYRGFGVDWTGGSCIVGARAVAAEWLFAEGASGDAWHEYLCLQNPNSSDALVRVNYYSQERGVISPEQFVLPAHSRVTLVVNRHAGPDLQLAARVRVSSGPGIIAERSQYFDFGGWDGGDVLLGVNPTL